MLFRVLLLAGIFVMSCSPAGTQLKGKPDQSVSEARKVPPFPPKGVSVKAEGKHTVVTWDPIPLDNIVGYKVYRKVGDEPFTSVGTVQRPPFVDKSSPSGSALYTVTAINGYHAESSLATPAKK
jgi:hypothetical protein